MLKYYDPLSLIKQLILDRVVQFIRKVHLSFTLFTQSANLIFRSGQLGLRHSLLQQDSLDPQEETCSARFWGHHQGS